MTKKLHISTKPEEFDVPEDWDGAVSRDGESPVSIKARYWKPGDEVQCMIRINGRLSPVSFTVGEIQEVMV